MPLPQVQAKSGKMYAADSPQGKMIVQAQQGAAASAVGSNSFLENSSTVASGFVLVDKHLEDIKGILTPMAIDVTSITRLLLMDAEKDARGDALRAADVTQDSTELAGGAGGDAGIGGGAGGGDGGDDGLAGLGGMAGFIGGLGKGLQFWGSPKAALGVPIFLAFLGGMVGVALLGSIAFRKAAPSIAEGMETLSNADIDTEKVVGIAKAMASMGGALAAEGIGAGIGSLGSLVSGVVDGLGGLIGVDKRDPMEEMKAFAQHEFSESEIKQIELNARGLRAFGIAMAAEGIGSAVEDIAGLVGGVTRGLTALIPVTPKADPMLRMRAFADHIFDQDDVDQIKLNAAALIGFSTVMATVETIGVAEDIAKLASGVVNFAASFFPEGKDPMVEMRKFAEHKFTQDEVDQIKLNAGALLAFSGTMGVAKTMGAVGDVTGLFGGIANGLSSLFGLDKSDPMAEMKEFAKEKITQDEADQISLNATALVNFSKAMALYSASGAAADGLDLVGSMAKGITSFFGGTTGIDYEEIKTFAASDIGDLEPKITANATALATFAAAMATMAEDSVDVEWTNLGANILGAIGSFLGGDANENLLGQFDAIEKFTERELNLKKVDNNIEAINKFMEFGQSWVDFKGGDFDAVGDFAESLVISANGINTAMYGGEYIKPGFDWNITIPDGKGLAAVELGHMTSAAKGIAVLRHSLIAQEPLKALQAATSAQVGTGTGPVTIVNAQNQSTNTKSESNNYQEMSIDHNEQTGHWWSRNSDLNPH